MVTVKEGNHYYQYMVFFKRHVVFQANLCLQGMPAPTVQSPILLKGDVIVMRVGIVSAYINMRGRDRTRADFLITQ